jgi:hypothetical protein
MEEDCYCNTFNGKSNYFSEFLKTFKVIAASNFKGGEDDKRWEHTEIVKCKKCNSYYIRDSNTRRYFDDDKISAKKYTPTIDDEGLKRILKGLEGIVSESDIEVSSRTLNRLREEKADIISDNYTNATQN